MDPVELDAGEFSAWLRQTRGALRTGASVEVACGECVGCCSSSMFIHVKPHEKGALGRISHERLVRAPGMENGHMLMGYDEHGHCPMLAAGKCTIYADRPETCRAYDCRVFTAAGLHAGGPEKSVINARVQQWAFRYPAERDRREHAAVRAVAAFVREHVSSFPGGRAPTEPSQAAIVALKVYEVFLESHERSPAETALAIVDAVRRFDAEGSPSYGR